MKFFEFLKKNLCFLNRIQINNDKKGLTCFLISIIMNKQNKNKELQKYGKFF